jgi:hypothetical protein
VQVCGLESFGLEQDPVLGFCEHRSEFLEGLAPVVMSVKYLNENIYEFT